MSDERAIMQNLDYLRGKIQEENFLYGKGLSNEVNIWFFCYEAEDEMAVRHFISQIVTDQTLKCRVIEKNLYQMFLQICDENRITERIPAMEERKGGENLLRQMSGIITKEEFIAKTQYGEHTPGKDVLLITGVGEAFPFIRVHTLLEALQPAFPDIPILVMYPGIFKDYQVKLFNRLKPHQYYCAFNII